MDREKQKYWEQKFIDDTQWLKNHLAPDDVYDFAMQAVYTAEYTMSVLDELVDLECEFEKDPHLMRLLDNLLGLRRMQLSGTSTMINTDIFRKSDEDNNSG